MRFSLFSVQEMPESRHSSLNTFNLIIIYITNPSFEPLHPATAGVHIRLDPTTSFCTQLNHKTPGSESLKRPLNDLCVSADGPCPEGRDVTHLWTAHGEDQTANHLLQHLSDPLQLGGSFALRHSESCELAEPKHTDSIQYFLRSTP